MDKKIALTNIPTGWQSLLKRMEIGESHSFHNIDNTIIRGRQAIKRYYAKVQKGEVAPKKFKTITDEESHTFTITRIE